MSKPIYIDMELMHIVCWMRGSLVADFYRLLEEKMRKAVGDEQAFLR